MTTKEHIMRDKYNIETGKRIRTERLILGFTQEEMAEKLDISERQYRRYENGKTIITSRLLSQLDKYGFDTFYIFFGIVESDYYVTIGLETMPQEELNLIMEHVPEINDHNPEHNKDKTEEICRILDECQRYGKRHKKAERLRKVEQCRIMTSFHEELALMNTNISKQKRKLH